MSKWRSDRTQSF